jgi:hypothetical protein
MRRRAILILLVAAAALAVPAPPLGALSVPLPPKSQQLTISGFVIGRVAKGNLVRFGFLVTGSSEGWLGVRFVKLVLLLHGHALEEVVFFPKQERLRVGDQPAVSINTATPVTSGFFRVNPHTVRMIRSTDGIRLTLWARVREPIPKGTTFRVIAREEKGRISYAREKVGVYGGFLTWGTFAIGFLLALLLGALGTNLRHAGRLRERQPSIWDILERRLREERARPPALVGVGGNGGPG